MTFSKWPFGISFNTVMYFLPVRVMHGVISVNHFYSDGFSHTYLYTTGIGLPIVFFKGSQVEFLNYDVFLSL